MFTCDELKLFQLQLLQPRHGYRYSLDPLLLARFCAQLPAGGSAIDLGAGCGVIALVLARINPAATVRAVENNPEMASLLAQNIINNGLAERVTPHVADVLSLRSELSDSLYDLVVTNPPFRTRVSGRVSPRAGRDAARHETTAGLADFLDAAKYLVKPSGKICFIHLPSRLQEFVTLASQKKLAVLRIRMVHNKIGAPATMFMAELAKGRKTAPIVEAPLFVRNADGDYSDEVWR